MNIAIISRGLPGSCKSSFFKLLLKMDAISPENVAIHSTDDKHMVDGKYCWTQENAGRFHQENFQDFCNSILIKHIPLVICDNTNLAPREYRHYVEYAKASGYKVFAVVFEPGDASLHFERNIHNVPMETIVKMKERFQIETEGVDCQLLIPFEFNAEREEVVMRALDIIVKTLQMPL